MSHVVNISHKSAACVSFQYRKPD